MNNLVLNQFKNFLQSHKAVERYCIECERDHSMAYYKKGIGAYLLISGTFIWPYREAYFWGSISTEWITIVHEKHLGKIHLDISVCDIVKYLRNPYPFGENKESIF